jgi:hypothetical protein
LALERFDRLDVCKLSAQRKTFNHPILILHLNPPYLPVAGGRQTPAADQQMLESELNE